MLQKKHLLRRASKGRQVLCQRKIIWEQQASRSSERNMRGSYGHCLYPSSSAKGRGGKWYPYALGKWKRELHTEVKGWEGVAWNTELKATEYKSRDIKENRHGHSKAAGRRRHSWCLPASCWVVASPSWKQFLLFLPFSKSCFSFLLSASKIQFFSCARPIQVHRS